MDVSDHERTHAGLYQVERPEARPVPGSTLPIIDVRPSGAYHGMCRLSDMSEHIILQGGRFAGTQRRDQVLCRANHSLRGTPYRPHVRGKKILSYLALHGGRGIGEAR